MHGAALVLRKRSSSSLAGGSSGTFSKKNNKYKCIYYINILYLRYLS